MINYCEIVDKALGHEISQHRTLRTCLDPGSSEWDETTMAEKVEIIRKVSAMKDLSIILRLYKITYKEMNKAYVADNIENGLVHLLTHCLSSTGK